MCIICSAWTRAGTIRALNMTEGEPMERILTYHVKLKKGKSVDKYHDAAVIMSIITNHPHVETVTVTYQDIKNTRLSTGNTQSK